MIPLSLARPASPAVRCFFLGASLALFVSCGPKGPRPAPTEEGEADAAAPDGWTALFNGKDLDGWTPKIVGHPLGVNALDTFRVDGGILRVDYSEYDAFDGRFGHLFYDEPFSSYDLRVVYRFVGEQVPGGPGWALRNSGVMLHGQPPESMGVDQDFPVSIEAQFLGGAPEGGERTTANLCTPGTHVERGGELVTDHCVGSTSETYRGDEWVTVLLEVRGNESIRHIIDGDVVLEYQRPQLDPSDSGAQARLGAGADAMLTGGSISLQAESHPVEFRSVEIRLVPEPTSGR